MPALNVYAVNASGGAWVNLPVTIPAHRCVIEEDGLTPQGLVIQFWDFQTGTWGETTTWLAGEAASIIGHGVSGVLGYPAQGTSGGFNYIAAGNYARATSATATPTNVRVTESEN